jgi:hypothetical protein
VGEGGGGEGGGKKEWAGDYHAELFRSMNTANKLGPHAQTDRGTSPGVGL